MSFKPSIEDAASDQDLLVHLNSRKRILSAVYPLSNGPLRHAGVTGSGSEVEPLLGVVGLR
jgi:hypothetical protein